MGGLRPGSTTGHSSVPKGERAALSLFLCVVCVVVAACAPQKIRVVPPHHRVFLPLAQKGEWIKKGLGVTHGVCAEAVGAGWHYDWSQAPVTCWGRQAVPMVWCREPLTVEVGHGPLLALNEPDVNSQCHLGALAAALRWRELEETYPQACLIGPGVSQEGAQWLADWRAMYQRLFGTSPRICALPVHCYGDAAHCRAWVEANIAWARQWTETGRVWVTEYATLPCWFDGDVARAVREMDEFTAYLEAEPAVYAYAVFASLVNGDEAWAFRPVECNTSLVTAQGELSEFGEWYAGR